MAKFACALISCFAVFTVNNSEAAVTVSAAESTGAREGPAQASVAVTKLNFSQSQAFRSWFVRIIKDQLTRKPDPRWYHRDCAGLVRFGVYEALRPHSDAWLRANGQLIRDLPPEVDLNPDQRVWLNRWKREDGSSGSYVPALGIIQNNSDFVSKDINQARPGDLLFFDQGEDQHLMIWMGSYVAYHRGIEKGQDKGLRTVSWQQLMNGQDTRWQTRADNPNFVGIYRLSFLSY